MLISDTVFLLGSNCRVLGQATGVPRYLAGDVFVRDLVRGSH